MDRTYLGDGVYAEFDGFHIVLTTERGKIYLEDVVFLALVSYGNTVFGFLNDEDKEE